MNIQTVLSCVDIIYVENLVDNVENLVDNKENPVNRAYWL